MLMNSAFTAELRKSLYAGDKAVTYLLLFLYKEEDHSERAVPCENQSSATENSEI